MDDDVVVVARAGARRRTTGETEEEKSDDEGELSGEEAREGSFAAPATRPLACGPFADVGEALDAMLAAAETALRVTGGSAMAIRG